MSSNLFRPPAFACLALAIVLFAWSAVHAALPPGVRAVASVEGVTEYRLDNGLRLLLAPDNAKPLVTVNMVYLVGSRHEGPGEGGMAHLLEHLVFKGTPATPDPKAQFAQRGMQWNGTTSFDRTNYYATFNDEGDNLHWYLGWLADAMVNSFIARRDLDSEMTVVRNEFERADGRADVVLHQTMLATAYQWHPYGKAVIGALSDIENVSISSLQEFYRHYYQPDNAVLVVAGKIDADAVLARVAATFGTLPRPTRMLTPSYTLEPVQQGERSVTLRRIAGAPMMAVAYHAAAAGSKAFAAQAVLRQILTGAPSGRLHQTLVESGLAASLSDWTQITEEPGLIYLSAVLAEGADTDRAQMIMLHALESMAPVSEAEVERAKTLIVNAIKRSLLDAQSLAMGLTDSISAGDWRLRFAMRDWIEDVTVADVEQHARAYLVQSNRTLGRFIPTTQPQRAPQTQRADTAALLKDYRGRDAAAPIQEFPLTNLDIEARTVKTALPGGMKLALLPRPAKGERVVGTLRLHWGSLQSLNGKRGDALLLAAMMLKGSRTHSRSELNNRLSELDSSINVSGASPSTGGLTGLVVDFSAPRENLPRVLEMMADALRNPEFADVEFEQARRAYLAQGGVAQNDPSMLAMNALARHLVRYPADDPRSAYSLAQSQELARAASLERLQAFYREHAGASNAELAMVGPVDAAQVTQQLRALFDDWRSPQAYERIARPLQAVPVERIVLDMPEKSNAAYAAALPLALDETDADVPALYAAVQLLGGRAGSRLWERLREREGLSYGVQSSMSIGMQDRNGRIGISGSFAPQNRARFESALHEELEKVLKDGFSAQEVGVAKDVILRNRRQHLTQERNVAATLAANLYWGRTMEWREQRDKDYTVLTAERVNAVLRKYLDRAQLSAVVAGNFGAK